jgi:hypothetical protein
MSFDDDGGAAPLELSGSTGADGLSPASTFTVGGSRWNGGAEAGGSDDAHVREMARLMAVLDRQRASFETGAAAGGRGGGGGAAAPPPAPAARPPAPAPPPPAPAGDAARLAARVQVQARELADLSGSLGRAEAYSRLLERRLAELAPEHPLPVTEAALGTHVARLSNLAAGAAALLVESAGGATPGRGGGGGGGGGAHRKEARDAAEALKTMEKTLDGKRKLLDDATARIRELRGALEGKEKERAAAARRADGLASRLVSLEAELRMVGGGGSGSGGGGGGGGAPSTAAARAAAAAASAAASPAGEPLSVVALRARIDVLTTELAGVAAARDAGAEALAREARACADARATAAALERSFAARLREGGVREDAAALLTRVAVLQGEAEARARDSAAKDGVVEGLVARVRALEAAAAGAAARAAAAADAEARAKVVPVAAGAPGATPQKAGGGGGGGILVRSPVGDISLNSHGAFTRALTSRARTLAPPPNAPPLLFRKPARAHTPAPTT